eukprot:Sspe_Gene.63650::Locus_36743_Transcript_1_1_Confidence_1.000_Length_1737::g.63650::m.63650
MWQFLLFLSAAGGALGGSPVIETSHGPVRGTVLDGVYEFLGMPFATAKRYEPPVDYTGKYPESPLNATDFAYACLQVGNSPTEVYGSEDCLAVNIWKPSWAAKGDKLPVVCYIYGGSNQFGETEPYNGSALAALHGVVYASIAYRTGPIGWMAFREDRDAGRTTGNYGMLDQQSGLRWLRRELPNFSGDPDRIIIHGQSSGAELTELHLVMPGSKGLIRGLVSESGGLGAGNLTEAIQATEAIAKEIGCAAPGVKQCMQQAKPVDLTKQTYQYSWGPNVDGVVIREDPMTSLREGRVNDISVILGAQTNDSFRDISKQYMKGGKIAPLSVSDYEHSAGRSVPSSMVGQLLDLYPADHTDLTQNVHSLGRISSDSMLCSIRRRASIANQHLPGKVFVYRFNYWYQSNPECSSEPNYHPAWMGAVHEDEVTFVMGQPIFMFEGSCCGKFGARLTREPCPQSPDCTKCYNESLGTGYHAYFNDKEFRFAWNMGSFWSNLSAYGTPNGEHATGPWPVHTSGEITHNIVLDADLPGMSKVERTLYDAPVFCNFWDKVHSSS